MANNAGHNAEWRGDRLLIFVGFFIPIQVICVALRYLAGRLAQRPWGLDDLLVFTSLALQMALAGLSIGEPSSSRKLVHATRSNTEGAQAPSSLPELAIT